ncbi:hypothetical protein HK098_008021 [Nowakowskiella sp. JEL0407]|nr:hypothetical protein HK098_008021 [Nowakowskiella sp. JEL0407]
MSAKKEFSLFPFQHFRPNVPFIENASVSPLPIEKVDPWAKRELWRSHPFFSVRNRMMNVFPGLGIATVAFGIFLGYEYWNNNFGEAAAENRKWEKWMHERNERLKKEGHGSHH